MKGPTAMDDDLKANYIALHESTGESYESIAARNESSPGLAAFLRGLAAGNGETRAEEAPKARRSGKASVAAAESSKEE